jgi:hypothetical protein
MDDLIWIDPDKNGAVGDCWHNACTEPREGYVLYARVKTLAEAERNQGLSRRNQSEGTQ